MTVPVVDDGPGVDPDSLDLQFDGTPLDHVWRVGTSSTPSWLAGSPRAASGRRSCALAARVGAAWTRAVIVRLRAWPRQRIELRVRCGQIVRTLRVRANARGIALLRVACPGAATVRLALAPGRVLVRIAARRLPLRLQVVPQSGLAPTLVELRVGAISCSRPSRPPAGAASASCTSTPPAAFATSFGIVRPGQFDKLGVTGSSLASLIR